MLSPFVRSFRGGVSVAAADVNGDRAADLIVGSGAGLQATVEILDGATHELLDSFAPFTSFRGGLSVAAARIDGDPAVVVGSGPGTTAVARAFAYQMRNPLWSVDAFAPTFAGGSAVAAGALAGATPAVVVGAGAGGGSQVKVVDGTTLP